MLSIARQPANERGTFTLLGLMLFIGFIIPIFILVSNLSTITNASSQAHGLAYNLAFAGVNRGVDGSQTRQAGSIVMLRESLDGSNPAVQGDPDGRGGIGPSKVEKLNAAYDEMNEVAGKMKQSAGLTGGSSRSEMTVLNAPANPATTGYASDFSQFTSRPMALYSVPFDPTDATFYTRLYNGGDCNVPGGQTVGFAGSSTTYTCWVDSRERFVSPDVKSAFPRAFVDQNAYVDPSQWAHYTSGAEVQVEVKSKLWFGGDWLDRKIGVAAFGRPCDISRTSRIFGTVAPGAHCQY